MNKEEMMEKVAAAVKACKKCRLHAGALNAVPGEGNIASEIVFIGEAPGRTEDETGRPFVGRAGKLLEQSLGDIGLSRKDVWIGNIVKHRPPENRDPLPDDIRFRVHKDRDARGKVGDLPMLAHDGDHLIDLLRAAGCRGQTELRGHSCSLKKDARIITQLNPKVTKNPMSTWPMHGLTPYTVLKLVAEIGTDPSRWPTEKHFTSWLTLAPKNKISGGRLLSSWTQPSANRAAAVLRMTAMSLGRTQTALGAFSRRLAARIGKPQAITATARTLAILVYRALKGELLYRDPGADAYDGQQRTRVLRRLRQRAATLGFELVNRETGEILEPATS